MQVFDAGAVSVVVQAFAQFPERFDLGAAQSEPGRDGSGLSAQVIAESGHDRPGAIAALQVAVDDQAGANRSGRIDMGFEQG